MSLYVIDASVAVKLFFEEEHTQDARRIVAADYKLCAPELFLLEMDNLMCKRIRRDLISFEQAQTFRSLVRRLAVRIYPDSVLLDSAFQIAYETNRSLYDCLYLALADLLGGQMVTADRRLCDGLAGTPFASRVLWIEDAVQSRNET